MNSKFNKRLIDVTTKNKDKQYNVVKRKDVEHLLYDDKPLSTCIIWLYNPYELAIENFDEVEQNEWVGNGAFIDPGKIAALSPWNLNKVLLAPVKITNTAVDLVREEEGGQKKAYMGAYDAKFNTSVPLIDSYENLDAIRLALYFMTRSTEGNRELSQMITSVPDLYHPAMINALYSTATLSTLICAEIISQCRLAFQAYLTLLSISLYEHKGKNSSDYFNQIVRDLVSNPVKFIARKDETELPHITRMMIVLNNNVNGLSLKNDIVNDIFLKLFIRICSDQTSQSYTLDEILGIDLNEYAERVQKQIESINDESLYKLTPPEALLGTMNKKIKIDFRKLFALYGIHKIMKDYLTSNDISIDQFHYKVLKREISLDVCS